MVWVAVVRVLETEAGAALMDTEKLFAELCATAPEMPATWAPVGVDRLPFGMAAAGLDAVDAMYAQATGASIVGTLQDKRAEMFALAEWYKRLRAKQTAELEPKWRVAYARTIIAALGDN